jgi:hypothetical protein
VPALLQLRPPPCGRCPSVRRDPRVEPEAPTPNPGPPSPSSRDDVERDLDVPFSACDTGSSSFAPSARVAEALLVEARTRPVTSSAMLVIPVPGTKLEVALTPDSPADCPPGRARARGPSRSRTLRGGDQLLRARAAGLVGSEREAQVIETPERIAAGDSICPSPEQLPAPRHLASARRHRSASSDSGAVTLRG